MAKAEVWLKYKRLSVLLEAPVVVATELLPLEVDAAEPTRLADAVIIEKEDFSELRFEFEFEFAMYSCQC